MSLALIYVIATAGAWLLIFGVFDIQHALLGVIFGAALVTITGVGRGRVVPFSQIPKRLMYLAFYALILIPLDIVESNLDLARRLIRLKPDIRPGIIRVSLGNVSEATSALIAHAITMSPGELVVDYSDDGRTIYVHLIDVTNADIRSASIWRLYHTVLERIFS